ncbi:hypothetical protein FRB95_007025 [Tulasnella sp. JGI-2019a]|nr:hypothetical protein FRB95_007025 [Tulasnella sp. JGI-2019a]
MFTSLSTSPSDTLPAYQPLDSFPPRDSHLESSSSPNATVIAGRELGIASPPTYDETDAPAPAYEDVQEPPTAARLLFRCGFCESRDYNLDWPPNTHPLKSYFFVPLDFPFFWIIGVIILVSDLKPIPEHECGKTAAEQAEEIAIIRRVELRWARKCAFALILFILIIGLLFIGLCLGRVGIFQH